MRCQRFSLGSEPKIDRSFFAVIDNKPGSIQ